MKGLISWLAVFLLLVSSSAFGQSRGADIRGTVVRTNGSPIPGVSVTLTGEETGTKETVTSKDGEFTGKLYGLIP